MDDSTYALLLMVLGIALIIAEVFLPSGGGLTVASVLSVIAAIVFGWRAWGTSHPGRFWVFVSLATLSLPTLFLVALYFLPKTPFGKKLLLEAPQLEEVTPYAHEHARLRKFVGQSAEVLTLMAPGGIVAIDGERFHAESEGLMIESGRIVEVVDVRGNRLVVRETTIDKSSQPKLAQEGTDRPLDFDLSEG